MSEAKPRIYTIQRRRTLQLAPAVGWRLLSVWADETGDGVDLAEWPIACFALVETWTLETQSPHVVSRAPEAPWHTDPDGAAYGRDWSVGEPSMQPVGVQDAGAYLDIEDDSVDQIILGPGQDAGDEWVRVEVKRLADNQRRRRQRDTPPSEAAS